MLIVGDDIITNNLLNNINEENIRNSSYYLEIHSIIPTGKGLEGYEPNKPKTTHTIKPGEMARVISKEEFQISDHGITALVTLRSSMTKLGLLALDVGIVDASYEGPIGSIVINFSKNEIALQEGMEFFRVIFFRHNVVSDKYRYPREKLNHEEYIRARFSETVNGFPEMFVQSDVVIDRLEGDVIDKLTTRILTKYWWRIILIILGFGSILGISVFWAAVEFGPNFSKDEIQTMITDYIRSQIPGKLDN